MALWDSAGGFLQIVPCAVRLNQSHTLEVTARGAHFLAAVDGVSVINYWDRTLPHLGGQSGLAVYKSRTVVESFNIEKLPTDSTPMPPHKPNFRFDTNGVNQLVLYDGYEPISHFWKGSRDGGLFQGAMKLKPGWRAACYSQVGPALNYKWPKLVGALPAAMQVEGGGESIRCRFQTEGLAGRRCGLTGRAVPASPCTSI